jgi:hypothetical protein
MGTPLLVGAYATAPRVDSAGRPEETSFYAALHAIPNFGGFEVPLLTGGVMHATDERWLLGALFPRVAEGGKRPPSVILTCVPATMTALGSDPNFGLASDDARGRTAALALAKQARDAVARLNLAAGRRAVVAVEVQSAPCALRSARTSVASFIASLSEIAAWDWEGAVLVVEHCDAAPPSEVAASKHAPIKGFLSLTEEIEAVRAVNAAAPAGQLPVGVSINWARSVLETRDAATADAHISLAGDLLRGIIFSGCSGAPEDTGYGSWQDSHMPHADAARGSLLTAACVRSALAAAKAASAAPLLFTGAKITLQPDAAPAAARAAANADLLRIIKEANSSY